MDATRDQVIRWCREHGANFLEPIYPPPDGWMWADADGGALVLTAIFTNTEDSDITSADAGIQHSSAMH